MHSRHRLPNYLQLQSETGETAQTTGSTSLTDFYIRFKQLPYANLQIGQFKTFFNRTQLVSTAELQFVDRAVVQDAFPANGYERRDQGITVLNDASQYRVTYALGLFNGTGRGVTNGGFANSNGFLYVGRVEANLLGKPGFDQGDPNDSATPQVAVASGYAYNRSVDTNAAAIATSLRNIGNGRLANQGTVNLGTFNVEAVLKYRGTSVQGEYYFRNQDRATPSATILGNASGYYVQSGYYVRPKTVEIQVRYGLFDPDTRAAGDLVRERNVGLHWLFRGHDHKLSLDYSGIQSGIGNSQELRENRVRLQYQIFI